MTCDPAVTYAPLRRVAILGGTHGNEMSGVFLAHHWLKNPSEIQRSTFSVMPLVANQPAVQRCIRYVERDLNRCFLPEILNMESAGTLPYEVARAQELNRLLGPRGSEGAMDFLIDLHNTTANMGDCLILRKSSRHLTSQLASYIQGSSVGSRCRVLALDLKADTMYLASVGKHDIGIELGPQPHGVVRAENLQRMRQIVQMALDFVELFNQGMEFPDCELEIYRWVMNVDFPRDSDGDISAVIHPERQDKDWLPLNPGDPVFLTMGGETIPYSGDGTVYPVFINEAAYYEKKIAFSLTERVRIRVPRIRGDVDRGGQSRV